MINMIYIIIYQLKKDFIYTDDSFYFLGVCSIQMFQMFQIFYKVFLSFNCDHHSTNDITVEPKIPYEGPDQADKNFDLIAL